RQVGDRDRAAKRRGAGLLGGLRLPHLRRPVAGTAIRGRLSWLLGEVVELMHETPSVRRIVFDCPGWRGHVPVQHVDVRLTPEDGIQVIHTQTGWQPPSWEGYARRVDSEMLAEVAWPVHEAGPVFVCGPTGLVEAVATALTELGHDPARIKTQRFGPTGGRP